MGILDKARKRIAQINEKKGEFAQTEFWKPHTIKADDDEGDRVRMICPPYLDKPDMEPWVESAQYVIPVKGDVKYYTHAPSKFGLEDVVQEYRKELYRAGDEQSKKKAKTLNARDVYFCLIIDLNEPEKGVQIWTFGNQIMEVLCQKLLNDEYNIFWDFDKGHDLIVKRYGEGLETKYVVDLSPKPRSVIEAIERVIGNDELEKLEITKESILEQANSVDLANFVKVDTSESLEEMLLGKWGDDYDERFKKRREERDATQGRPLPYFVPRENTLTAEEVENRKRVEKQDAEEADALFGPMPKDDIPFESDSTAATTKSSSDEPIGKTYSFVDVDASDQGETVTGKCTAVRMDDELGECYVLDCGENGTYEVPVDECTEVEQKKVRRFKKPEKTEKQSSVLDRVKAIKDESD